MRKKQVHVIQNSSRTKNNMYALEFKTQSYMYSHVRRHKTTLCETATKNRAHAVKIKLRHPDTNVNSPPSLVLSKATHGSKIKMLENKI